MARWHDGKWQPLGAGLDDDVNALAVFDDMLIAGGQYTFSAGRAVGPVVAWDGKSWRSLGEPASGIVASLDVHELDRRAIA